MKQKFELTLTSNYAHQWGLQEALREILQNAIDQESQMKDNQMNVEYNDGILSISNKNSILQKKSLLLGYSSKQNDEDTIGQFGEGYKIALLVLTRLNKKVTIYNYGKREVWTVKFVKSKRYEGEEILTITIDTEPVWERIPHSNLSIEIEGITDLDYEELIRRSLPLQDNYKENTLKEEQGLILLDEKYKGMIFVNGLYVNNVKSLEYGYSIKPKYVNIGRDRDLMSDYDVFAITSDMWLYQKDERRDVLIENNSYDTRYIMQSKYKKEKETKEIQKITFDKFLKKHGKNAIPVSSTTELEYTTRTYENVRPVIINSTQHEILRNYEELDEHIQTFKKKEMSSLEKYNLWKEKYEFDILDSDKLFELDEIVLKYL